MHGDRIPPNDLEGAFTMPRIVCNIWEKERDAWAHEMMLAMNAWMDVRARLAP